MSDDKSAAEWRAYYEATAGRPPRPTLLWALERCEPRATGGRAVDLGCGDGRDTIELLRRGWSVLAIDAEPLALERLRARPDLPAAAHLTTLCSKFEELDWPLRDWAEVDLINASFALPLCPPPSFPRLWDGITVALAAGGYFAGQLYGERDDWAGNPMMTILDEAGARRLLAAYIVERFEIEESDAVTPRGQKKHWHIFHIVARKR